MNKNTPCRRILLLDTWILITLQERYFSWIPEYEHFFDEECSSWIAEDSRVKKDTLLNHLKMNDPLKNDILHEFLKMNTTEYLQMKTLAIRNTPPGYLNMNTPWRRVLLFDTWIWIILWRRILLLDTWRLSCEGEEINSSLTPEDEYSSKEWYSFISWDENFSNKNSPTGNLKMNTPLMKYTVRGYVEYPLKKDTSCGHLKMNTPWYSSWIPEDGHLSKEWYSSWILEDEYSWIPGKENSSN